MFARNIVMCQCQRADAPADQVGEVAHIAHLGPRLTDQATDQRQDIADPVIEFGDQQVLPFLSALPLLHGFLGDPQDHLQQGNPQAFGDGQFFLGPRRAAPTHRLLPCSEALARGQARAIGSVFDRLFRIARPVDDARQFATPQHHVVARSARDGDNQCASQRGGLVGSLRQQGAYVLGLDDGADRCAVERGQEGAKLLLVRRDTARLVDAVDKGAGPVLRDDPADLFLEQWQVIGDRAVVGQLRDHPVVQHLRPLLEQVAGIADRDLQLQREQLCKQLGQRA